MVSKASIANHPIHPMLVAFPIGLWLFSLVADAVFWAGGGPEWAIVARYTIGGGIIGAVAAAVPGFIDLVSMKSPDIKRTGTMHAILNVAALVLFIVNFLMRNSESPTTLTAFILSIIGAGIIMVSGWMGGEMVYEYGAAVEPVKPGEEQPEYWKKAA
jgi:uncharacterized membrane protein